MDPNNKHPGVNWFLVLGGKTQQIVTLFLNCFLKGIN